MRAFIPLRQKRLLTCPRCKQRVLNLDDCGESAIYRSRHLICVPCFHDEDAEIDREGGNDLPKTLAAYGHSNDIRDDD